MELRLVEARPMAEDAGMLAEALAVVRGDDHPGPIEDPAAAELVDQPAQLLVEIRDAVVVGVASRMRSAARKARAWPAATSPGSGRSRGRCAARSRTGGSPVLGS